MENWEYLFGVRVHRGGVAIPLTINGGVSATADSIHLPLGEIVVHHVYVAASTPRHTLHQLLTEVVEGYGHLHPGIRQVLVVVPQQHHLVVVREVAVRYRYPRRPHYRVNQTVRAVRQRAVVDPQVARVEDGYPITVRFASPTDVRWARPYVSVT